MPCRRSGPARRARTCTWRNRRPGASGKAGRWSRPRKYGRMVQVGTQNRSNPIIREGMQQLKDGLIGDLYMARGMTYKMRGNLGKHNPRPVPAGLNWNAWVGPAKWSSTANSNIAAGTIFELRQRRRRQPDRPRYRQDPLGTGPG